MGKTKWAFGQPNRNPEEKGCQNYLQVGSLGTTALPERELQVVKYAAETQFPVKDSLFNLISANS